MTFFQSERQRFNDFYHEANDKTVQRLLIGALKTGFYLFSPYVIVVNLMTFYALYQGIGYWISLVLLSILFAFSFYLLDWLTTRRKSAHPQKLFFLYYGVSLIFIIPGIVWGVL